MAEMSKSPEEIKKGMEWCFTIRDSCTGCPYGNMRICGNKLGVDALAYIQQLESQVPKWISVEDKLPEAKLAVLAYGRRYIRKTDTTELPAPHVAYTRGEDEGWFTWDYDDHVCVSHWMPLTAPTEEECNDKKR